MDRFPFHADPFEHQRHASRRGIWFVVEGLRLRPNTSHDRAVATQHRHVTIANVELYFFTLRERTLAVLLELVPSFGHAAVVIEQNQLRRIPIAAHV